MKSILISLTLGVIGCLSQTVAPETVLVNGTIYSIDATSQVFQHGEISFANASITCIGGKGECSPDAIPSTRIINLQGKTVIPGLIDAHAHPVDAGRAMLSCSLQYRHLELSQLLGLVHQCLNNEPNAPPDAMLTVSQFDREGFTDRNGPGNATMLDRLNTTRPVMLIATNQHNFWVNRRGLQLLNITAATPDPDGGRIGKDASGFPTGFLEENAAGGARALSGNRGVSDLEAATAGLSVLRRQGYTTILNALAGRTDAWQSLSRNNTLTARVFNAFGLFGSLDFPAVAAQARNVSEQFDDGAMVASRPGQFWRHVKFFVDGVLPAVSQSAMLVTPYLVNNSNRWVPGTNFGIPGSTPSQLESLFTNILGIKQGLHLHACSAAMQLPN
ncbi:Ff.00g041100.m01.CDS01 [Fusarium sp. VM40]|nr:Ff.00g041100.m01.CDS01 [Fusarium sp. VM40]